MSTIIECPACSTRYKMNKAIPEGGRSVKCARCGHQWRLLPDEPEELIDTLESEDDAPPPRNQPAASAHEARPAPSVDVEEGVASWEARRGNLAAAIASMSEPQAGVDDDEQAAADENFAQARDWVSQAPRYGDFASSAGETVAQETNTDDDAGSDRSSYTAEPGAWQNARWAGDAADADAQDGGDPEISVRDALKAAMDDQEADDGDPGFGPRPAFTDIRYADTRTTSARMDDGAQSDGEDPAPHTDGDRAGVAQISFSAREGHFPPAGTISLKETAEQAASADRPEETEQFENDIAGMFNKQPQAKRSFGPAAAGGRSEGSFPDYESGGSEQGDDRYMADSPLDADAAALQAALEGSLREKHAGEARAGGGGGLAVAAAWAVFLSVLSGVSLAFVNFREEIVEALPGTAALYRGVGFSVQERVVDFGAVTYRWTVAEGKPMIEVTGQIINLTDREIAVPRVLVQVHDKENTDTVKASATVRSEPLAARESADFTLEFLAPPKTITQIELAFADTE